MNLSEIDLTGLTIEELKLLTEKTLQQRQAREKEIITQRMLTLEPTIVKLNTEIEAVRPKIRVQHIKEPRDICWIYYVDGRPVHLNLLSEMEAEVHASGHYYRVLPDRAVPLFVALIRVYRMAQKEERAFARAIKDKKKGRE